MMPLPIALVAHAHHVVEVGIVEFRAFYYLCKVKLQHAAKISCGIALEFNAFYYLCKVKLQHAAKISCELWKLKGIFISKGLLPANTTVW